MAQPDETVMSPREVAAASIELSWRSPVTWKTILTLFVFAIFVWFVVDHSGSDAPKPRQQAPLQALLAATAICTSAIPVRGQASAPITTPMGWKRQKKVLPPKAAARLGKARNVIAMVANTVAGAIAGFVGVVAAFSWLVADYPAVLNTFVVNLLLNVAVGAWLTALIVRIALIRRSAEQVYPDKSNDG